MSESSVIDFYAVLRKICSKSENIVGLNDSKEQIDFILTNDLDFTDIYANLFVKALENETIRKGKSKIEADRHQQFYELYKNMPEAQFVDKTFDSLNKSITLIPFDSDTNELFLLFASRSNLNFQCENYRSALIDNGNALKLRLSCTMIEWRVEILKKLDRHREAYKFVSDFIFTNQFTLSKEKLSRLKKLKKSLKNFKSTRSDYYYFHQQNHLPEQDDRETSTMFDDEILGKQIRTFRCDPRLSMKLNQANRYSFFTSDSIPKSTEIFCEEPAFLSLTNEFHHQYCNRCCKRLQNSFWPCLNCNEVVFCSYECSRLAQEDYHRAECGLIGFMQKQISNHSYQAYRLFAKIGLSKLDTLIEKAKSLRLDDCFQKLSPVMRMDCIEEWFILNHINFCEKIRLKRPIHEAYDLSNAIMLAMIYCYKKNLDIEDLGKEKLINLIDWLALCLVRTQLNEFGWQDFNEQSGKKIQIGNFQCLFSSNLNHSCVPNVEWTFTDGKFHIKTLREIKKNEEICITYGSYKNYSFFKLQKFLQHFLIMCNCSKCLDEAKRCFSFRCEYCQGPIPFDSIEFVNKLCMSCENNTDLSSKKMISIQNQFNNAKRIVSMIDHISDESLQTQLENILNRLSCYVYLKHDQFIQMVDKLCDYFLGMKMWSKAIDWYQWFLDADVQLAQHHDDLVHYCRLDKWTNAFMNYLLDLISNETEDSNDDDDDDHPVIELNLLETIANHFEQLLSLSDSLQSGYGNDFIDYEQLRKIIKRSKIEIQERYDRFKRFYGNLNSSNDEKFPTLSDGEITASYESSESDSIA